MTDVVWRVRPVTTWPGEPTPPSERRAHPFRRQSSNGWMQSGVDWSATTDMLRRELEHLGAENIVLEMFVRDRDIRVDGWIRADAKPSEPGVVLSFFSTTLDMPLRYPADRFTKWQGNVRAIAVSLENLRRVDRYGVTKRGEQYVGWRQIPASTSGTDVAPTKAPADIIAEAAGLSVDAVFENFKRARRRALARSHPDAETGSEEAFKQVGAAIADIES